jgi:hypothetical protein
MMGRMLHLDGMDVDPSDTKLVVAGVYQAVTP